VDCDVWEQSRITDFLDINPTGQYLRSKYLGTPAERLSLDLLLDVGKATHREYAHGARVPSDPSMWTVRSLDPEVLAHADDPTVTAVLLVGESGFGKTVAAHRAMKRWLDRGTAALWVPAGVVESSYSLHAALDAVVRDRVPTVAEHCVRSLPTAVGGSRLLVVVDDINRATSPAVLLRRLLAWASTTADVVLLCPVWPRLLDPANLTDRRDLRQVRVGAFASSEAEAALGGTGSHGLAAALDYDPFLIGIARALAQSGIEVERSPKPRDVLRRFVEHQLGGMQAGEPGFRAVYDGCVRKKGDPGNAQHYAAFSLLAV